MRVNFFEEYPTLNNLKKARLIDFESKIVIGAQTLKKYGRHVRKLKRINPNLETAYWPIPKRSWYVSAFSHTHEIERFISDLRGCDEELQVLLDLELPFIKPKLFWKNLFSIVRNKRLIKKLFREQAALKINILTGEYAPTGWFEQLVLRLIGVNYSLKDYEHVRGVMLYSSLERFKFFKDLKKRFIVKQHKKHGDKLEVFLGTTAVGVFENEPIISAKQLDEDLQFLKNNGVNTVTIYRLGGLNKDYLRVIKKHV